MNRHPRVATGALGDVTTCRTNQGWREAAAIEEDQRLAADTEVSLYSCSQRFAKALDGLSAGQIDEPNVRWLRSASALWKFKPGEIAGTTMLQQFQRRCGRAENDRNVAVFRTSDGEIASRITQALLLLERVVVFFVNDNQAEVGEWCKYGRSGADYQRSCA
jgi:hypothetical protein